MLHTIITPFEIEYPLYEGQLEFVSESIEQATRGKGPESVRNVSDLSRPVVTLGQPQWWNLADLAEGNNPSAHIAVAVTGEEATHTYLTQLHQLLSTYFDEGEFRTLCFGLSVKYDDLPGEGTTNRARELVMYLERHGRVSELLKMGRQLRPDIHWKDGPEADTGTSMRTRHLPQEVSLLLGNSDFYLLLLACSFRPERDSQVEWARFTAYLRPKTGHNNPIAFDLYPREIYDEIKTDVKVSITPSFKFAAVEGKVGEVITTVEFRRLEPVVIGYGALESAPNWDFEKHRDQFLRGCKFCYLIVKKPRSAEAVRLTLDITADVVTRYGLLSARVTEKDRAHLTQIVCID